MQKILFASDIDNTLLFSPTKKQEGAVCIEMRQNIEQGFMTEKTYHAFPAMAEQVLFVPVTTRSVEQYRRVHWPQGYIPEFALVSNGAALLHRNETASDWHFLQRTPELQRELEAACRKYQNDERFIHCRIVDDAYVFLSCPDVPSAEQAEMALATENSLYVARSGRKIYFFPAGLDKGAALAHFCQTHAPGLLVAAGDSIMDLSMLKAADIAIIPHDYPYAAQIGGKVCRCPDENFSDYIMDVLAKIQ